MSDTPPPYPPPRNVIYFFRATNPISLAGIANLPYTDVILGFLIPDSTVTGLMGDGPAFTGFNRHRLACRISRAALDCGFVTAKIDRRSRSWETKAKRLATASLLRTLIWRIGSSVTGRDLSIPLASPSRRTLASVRGRRVAAT